jgi:hypothetical protein
MKPGKTLSKYGMVGCINVLMASKRSQEWSTTLGKKRRGDVLYYRKVGLEELIVLMVCLMLEI